eukprot:4135582-Lingulodinium_polyedra.AAC.1
MCKRGQKTIFKTEATAKKVSTQTGDVDRHPTRPRVFVGKPQRSPAPGSKDPAVLSLTIVFEE